MKKRLYNEFSAETPDAHFISNCLEKAIQEIFTHAQKENLCLRDCLGVAQMELVNRFSAEILLRALREKNNRKNG